MLFGAGSKAGLMPLHVWLPLVHPAAPSRLSLMSGVMTKIAIYGFIHHLRFAGTADLVGERVVLILAASPPSWGSSTP